MVRNANGASVLRATSRRAATARSGRAADAIGNGGRRYRSPLRDEQAGATRERILEALIRTMANGVAGLSIPAVAREASVSIPTIYRHFGSKQGLVAALAPYVVAKAGLIPDSLPESMADVELLAHTMFKRVDQMDHTLRAASASELGQQLRRAGMPERLAMHRQFLCRIAPELAEGDLEQLAPASVILFSSAQLRAYKDYLGLDVDQAADLAAWTLKTLIAGAQRARKGSE